MKKGINLLVAVLAIVVSLIIGFFSFANFFRTLGGEPNSWAMLITLILTLIGVIVPVISLFYLHKGDEKKNFVLLILNIVIVVLSVLLYVAFFVAFIKGDNYEASRTIVRYLFG